MATGKAHTYRDLEVWRRAMALARSLYEMTAAESFPDSEKFGLVSQMRRAVVSVPSNIAEGQARKGSKEFVRFLYVARGSLAELDTQCELARTLGYMDTNGYDTVRQEIDEQQRMLYALIRSLGGSK